MEADRQKWLGVLEIVAVRRPDEAEAEWGWIMKELGLGPEYFLAVYEAVRQGRWREAENPAGYIKKVAQREARRESPSGERRPRGLRGFQGLESCGEEITLGRGTKEMGGERFSGEETLEYLEYRQDSGKPTKEQDGTWRSAAGWGSDHEGLLRPVGGKPRRGSAKRLTQQQPGSLARYAERIERMKAAAGKDECDTPYIERGQEGIPDWQKWAAEAGLSEWEKKVVEYRMSGIGWRDAVAQQPDLASKRALRAAWKKLERSGWERLEGALKRGSEPSKPNP